MSTTAPERRDQLVALFKEARGCPKCSLCESRTQVVFGAGNADADLMFVGEAPGANEDLQGIPFIGRAGNLLNELLEEQGMKRADVFITNALKCLRYNSRVQLGDGSWERIGRLVRSRYAGTVMSIDHRGALVPRRVTGWHTSPLAGRPVYRLTYASAKRNGSSKVGVELTGDHPVLTKRGFVPAADIVSTDEVATGQGLSQHGLFDRVQIEDINDKSRADTTFFCIDVEGTHNFVTSGGVVHNCRPPANRDPKPDEIEACRPYLERQVELIEPKVICTLGNFATKLLSGSPLGITKVHGQPQERRLGARTVTLFPIFHPSAGLRTPAVKDQLREDFAKLSALLAAPAPEGHDDAPPADQLGLFG